MVRVFCDFDGTLTSEDVGNKLFQTFADGRAQEAVTSYREGSITARECLKRECEALGNVTPETIRTFSEECALDLHAMVFINACKANGVSFTVLSDGLDCYVEPILSKAGLNDIPWFANHGSFVDTDAGFRIIPSFPYMDEHCERCGNCKRNHIVTQSADEDIVVYVGDGISDFCPVAYADIVFAKGELRRHCQSRNISYFEFRNLGDVQERLVSLIKHNRIKHRREAVMARRDVFIAE